ncbi:apolipoprotein A1/A4/E family protein [Candidatus Micrarchaeota archaeon]|nr:apolipoprotein A1/A4/E family protein [Candidatus Micrarchaeota archaeon]
MKGVILLVLLVFCFSLVHAAAINVPERIPANINWSFSIELNPSDSFNTTEVYFDELLVITAFNNKPPVIHEDYVLKAFTFDSDPLSTSGLTLEIAYFGISKGMHEIKAVTYMKNSTVEELIEEIEAIHAVPEEFQEEVSSTLEGISSRLEEESNALNSLKEETDKKIGEKTDEINNMITALEGIKNEAEELRNEVTTELSSTEEEIDKKIELVEKQSVKKKPPRITTTTGLASTAKDYWLSGIIGLMVILIMVIFWAERRHLFDGGFKGKKLFEEKIDSGTQTKEEGKRTFAFKKQEKKAEDVRPSDLLKKF